MNTQNEHQEKQDFTEVGLLIKSFRLEKGYTSNDFARLLDISYPTLSRIENGHHGPNINVVGKLAELGMDTSELTIASRPHFKEQTLSYRLSELENKVVKMEQTIKTLLDVINKGE